MSPKAFEGLSPRGILWRSQEHSSLPHLQGAMVSLWALCRAHPCKWPGNLPCKSPATSNLQLQPVQGAEGVTVGLGPGLSVHRGDRVLRGGDPEQHPEEGRER